MRTEHLKPPEGIELGGGFWKQTSGISRYLTQTQFTSDTPHHQACVVVEELIKCESMTNLNHLGGGDVQKTKK